MEQVTETLTLGTAEPPLFMEEPQSELFMSLLSTGYISFMRLLSYETAQLSARL